VRLSVLFVESGQEMAAVDADKPVGDGGLDNATHVYTALRCTVLGAVAQQKSNPVFVCGPCLVCA
jgi:hypothetical protein